MPLTDATTLGRRLSRMIEERREEERRKKQLDALPEMSYSGLFPVLDESLLGVPPVAAPASAPPSAPLPEPAAKTPEPPVTADDFETTFRNLMTVALSPKKREEVERQKFKEAYQEYKEKVGQPLAGQLGGKVRGLLHSAFIGSPRAKGESKAGHILKRIGQGAAGLALTPVYGILGMGGAEGQYEREALAYARKEADAASSDALSKALSVAASGVRSTRVAKSEKSTALSRAERYGEASYLEQVSSINRAFLASSVGQRFSQVTTVEELNALPSSFTLPLGENKITIDFTPQEDVAEQAATNFVTRYGTRPGVQMQKSGAVVTITAVPVYRQGTKGTETIATTASTQGVTSGTAMVLRSQPTSVYRYYEGLKNEAFSDKVRVNRSTTTKEKTTAKKMTDKQFKDRVFTVFSSELTINRPNQMMPSAYGLGKSQVNLADPNLSPEQRRALFTRQAVRNIHGALGDKFNVGTKAEVTPSGRRVLRSVLVPTIPQNAADNYKPNINDILKPELRGKTFAVYELRNALKKAMSQTLDPAIADFIQPEEQTGIFIEAMKRILQSAGQDIEDSIYGSLRAVPPPGSR